MRWERANSHRELCAADAVSQSVSQLSPSVNSVSQLSQSHTLSHSSQSRLHQSFKVGPGPSNALLRLSLTLSNTTFRHTHSLPLSTDSSLCYHVELYSASRLFKGIGDSEHSKQSSISPLPRLIRPVADTVADTAAVIAAVADS